MKVLIVPIFFCLISACIDKARIPDATDPMKGDTIIDPVVPYNFEIQYDNAIKITPDIFPEGHRGMGALRLFINRHSRIERFETVFIRIRDKEKTMYNYISDRKSPQTDQLDTVLRAFIKTVKVKRINDGISERLEPYDIVIKLY